MIPTLHAAVSRRCRLLAAVLLCAGALAAPASQPTIEAGGAFDVRSAYLEPADHVYHLNATLDLALSQSMERALADGLPVVFELDISLVRQRRVWVDEHVASLSQRWRLQYHALSERYLVVNLNSGEQTSYPTLQASMAALADVHMLPVLDEALISKGNAYEASARVSAVIEGGLPNALRTMMFWVDWKRVTEWYTWTVTP